MYNSISCPDKKYETNNELNWITLRCSWMNEEYEKICEDGADLGQNVSQIGGTNEILVAQTARIALAIEECYVRYEVVQFIIAILPEISCNQKQRKNRIFLMQWIELNLTVRLDPNFSRR